MFQNTNSTLVRTIKVWQYFVVFLCLWLEKSIRVYKKGEFITLNLTRFCLKLFLFLAAMAKTKSGKEEVQVLLCAGTVGPRGRAVSLAAQSVAQNHHGAHTGGSCMPSAETAPRPQDRVPSRHSEPWPHRRRDADPVRFASPKGGRREREC